MHHVAAALYETCVFFRMCSHICPAWVQMTPWTEDANDVALEHALFAKLTHW